MLDYIRKMFSDDPTVSLVRVLTFFVVVNIMITWDIACLKAYVIQDIPWGVVSILAIMITGKTVQRFSKYDTKQDGDDK